MSVGVSGVNHLIGHNLMRQMDSFNFGFDSVSRAHFRSETVRGFNYFNKIDTWYSWREIVSVHWS